jgi:membrane protein implicated in regulation of membrane protease activity
MPMPNIITLVQVDWYFGLWLGVFILALIIEAAEPGLISIWFAGGALVAFILSLFPTIPLWVQIVAFIGTSGILLILSFVFFRKSFLNAQKVNTNLDSLIDEEVTLLTPCNKDVLGEVIYRDVTWKVTPQNHNDHFEVGEIAIVSNIRGNRLIIIKKGNE